MEVSDAPVVPTSAALRFGGPMLPCLPIATQLGALIIHSNAIGHVCLAILIPSLTPPPPRRAHGKPETSELDAMVKVAKSLA